MCLIGAAPRAAVAAPGGPTRGANPASNALAEASRGTAPNRAARRPSRVPLVRSRTNPSAGEMAAGTSFAVPPPVPGQASSNAPDQGAPGAACARYPPGRRAVRVAYCPEPNEPERGSCHACLAGPRRHLHERPRRLPDEPERLLPAPDALKRCTADWSRGSRRREPIEPERNLRRSGSTMPRPLRRSRPVERKPGPGARRASGPHRLLVKRTRADGSDVLMPPTTRPD